TEDTICPKAYFSGLAFTVLNAASQQEQPSSGQGHSGPAQGLLSSVGVLPQPEQKSQSPERRAGVMRLLVSGYAGKPYDAGLCHRHRAADGSELPTAVAVQEAWLPLLPVQWDSGLKGHRVLQRLGVFSDKDPRTHPQQQYPLFAFR
ncbi:hypothetical protein LEMLEM_LOCUS1585, partial [Lemmus lemmus]